MTTIKMTKKQKPKNLIELKIWIRNWVDLTNVDVSGLNSLEYAFEGVKEYTGSIKDWDTSNIVNMRGTFFWATNFNEDISNWDTSKVTNMAYLFSFAELFNQPIGSWNTSNVTDMEWMFYWAEWFNQNINDWDVSKVKNMEGVFYRSSRFNQPLEDWDITNVENMQFMFIGAVSFNQPLNKWGKQRKFNMDCVRRMFEHAESFNQDLSSWEIEDCDSNDIYHVANWTPKYENSKWFPKFVNLTDTLSNYINGVVVLELFNMEKEAISPTFDPKESQEYVPYTLIEWAVRLNTANGIYVSKTPLKAWENLFHLSGCILKYNKCGYWFHDGVRKDMIKKLITFFEQKRKINLVYVNWKEDSHLFAIVDLEKEG